MMSVLTGRYAMLKRTAGYSDLLFTFRGLPRRPVWVGWLTAAVFAQRFPEHYRLTVPVFRLSVVSPDRPAGFTCTPAHSAGDVQQNGTLLAPV